MILFKQKLVISVPLFLVLLLLFKMFNGCVKTSKQDVLKDLSRWIFLHSSIESFAFGTFCFCGVGQDE
jgi:hypothetical protein